jgi:hypothetical protein
MENRYGWLAAWFLVGSLALAGCGAGDSGNRAEVKGRVTLDGQPISEGAVNLIPIDGDTARVGGPISQGEYTIPRDRGPAPGKYRVEIFGFEPVTATRGADPTDSDAQSATRQVVPPKYNTRTELELDVSGSLVEKDFELTSS